MRRFTLLAVLLVLGCGGASEPPAAVEEHAAADSGVAKFGQSEIYWELAGEGDPTVILIHAGFAIEKLNPEKAEKALEEIANYINEAEKNE